VDPHTRPQHCISAIAGSARVAATAHRVCNRAFTSTATGAGCLRTGATCLELGQSPWGPRAWQRRAADARLRESSNWHLQAMCFCMEAGWLQQWR